MSLIKRDYGVGLTDSTAIYIPILKAGETDFAVGADWTPVAGDVKVIKDGGASTNIGTLPVYVADKGWKFILSTAELTSKFLEVRIVDSPVKAIQDQYFLVEARAGNYNGKIYVNIGSGVDGSVPTIHGTDRYPCKTWANIVALMASEKINSVHVLDGSGLVLGSSFQYGIMDGIKNYSVDTNGQSTDGALFINADINGCGYPSFGDTTFLKNCNLGSGIYYQPEAENCRLSGTLDIRSVTAEFIKCSNFINNSIIFELANAVPDSVLNIYDIDADSVEISGLGAGDKIVITGKINTLTLNGTTGSVKIAGNVANIVNNAGATLDTKANYNKNSEILSIYNKLPVAGLIASQISVDSIQNNTRFVSAIPASVLIPEAGDLIYKITGYFYNTQGGMEDPDSNEFAVKLRAVQGAVNKTNFFDDEAGTVPSSVSGTFGAPYYDMIRESQGIYSIYYKLPSTETPDQWTAEFKCKENTVDLAYTRNTVLFETEPGTATLAPTDANRLVIAEAIKNFDSSGVSLGADSIQKGIKDEIDGNETKIDTAISDIAGVQSTADGIDAQTSKIQFSATDKVKVDIEEVNALSDADGVSFNKSIQLSNGMVNGKLRENTPVAGQVTMYKRDNNSALTVYAVDDNNGTRDRIS